MKFETKLFSILGGTFLIVFLINVAYLYVSIQSYDGLVEDNYYNRALNYQEKKTEVDRQIHLGWKLDTTVEEENNKVKYILQAKDKTGKPLDKADVEVIFFRPTQSGFDKTINLKETNKGFYSGEVQLPLKGIWDIHLNFKKNGEKWKKKERIMSP